MGSAEMAEGSNFINKLSDEYQKNFKDQKVILSFDEYIDLVKKNPRRHIRNASSYLVDMIDHFGKRKLDKKNHSDFPRFKIFDIGTERNGPIIGGEAAQGTIYHILNSFVHQGGASSKLIMLHGPNGSAKSSTVEALAQGMQSYSETDEGAVYRFNWIFPSDKEMKISSRRDSSTIGFSTGSDEDSKRVDSYAFLSEEKIASKLSSEYKENPIFLIPMPYREEFLRSTISESEGCKPEEVSLPYNVLTSNLSKRNHEIFETLLSAHDGQISEVFRYIQVERFFFSKQYRVGISTVEPQMSIDAYEKQLTMDKNISTLPAVLRTINFHQAGGQLVEANRGIIELSDLLKRPVEAFKYLLSSIENNAINLPSGTANLDVVFFATSNEKHFDGFKTIPDFSSFRGRFDFVTVPYLLQPSQEEVIYQSDIESIEKRIKISPHSVRLLCLWAVLTRLKKPDETKYSKEVSSLVEKIDPLTKVKLYEGESLYPIFNNKDELKIKSMAKKIFNESKGMVVYEGRFGASPREIKSILFRAAEEVDDGDSLLPMHIFSQLTSLSKDKTTYDFLQFEPRGQYHDAALFIKIIKKEFARIFEAEMIQAMDLVDDEEYEKLLVRYVNHVVAQIKKSKIWDSVTETYENPSESVMKEIEEILGVKDQKATFRESLLSRIASSKLDNPKDDVDVCEVFDEYLQKIKLHYYNIKRSQIEENYKLMLMVDEKNGNSLTAEQKKMVESIYDSMDKRFNYNKKETKACLKFMLKVK